MGHFKNSSGFTNLAMLIATAILAFIFAFAPTAGAAEKTTTEEILDILDDDQANILQARLQVDF